MAWATRDLPSSVTTRALWTIRSGGLAARAGLEARSSASVESMAGPCEGSLSEHGGLPEDVVHGGASRVQPLLLTLDRCAPSGTMPGPSFLLTGVPLMGLENRD